MTRPPRIVEAVPLDGLQLRLTFSDGLVRELDLDPVLNGGVLQDLRDPVVFREVRVDEVAGTIAWPNGVDLDPDVLHGDFQPASGRSATLIREYRLQETG
ncbi:MAG TPA: DUF2442 domain-containing protein [Acidimicrobiales bacterium]|nr:DUF2442 domain-containing protein [Acidimicrobiales bacterium]